MFIVCCFAMQLQVCYCRVDWNGEGLR